MRGRNEDQRVESERDSGGFVLSGTSAAASPGINRTVAARR